MGWLCHQHTPFIGGSLTGWYTFGRPLVAGAIIGLILGDVQRGIILGSAVQALYIGHVTVGGGSAPDMNLATWISIPLGFVSGADEGIVVAMAASIGLLATVLSQPNFALTVWIVGIQRKMVQTGKLRQATLVPIWGNITKFLFKAVPIFLCCYFGQSFLTTVLEKSPDWLIGILTIFGAPMPLVGFAVLLKMVIKENLEFVYYLFGFAMVAAFGANIITVLIFAMVFAYIELKTARYVKGVDAHVRG